MEIGNYTLEQHQVDGVFHLWNVKHGILSYKPGKGKTLPAIYAVKEFCPNGKVLVISKKKIIDEMWKKDIEPLGLLPKKTTYINTELMNMNDEVFKNLEKSWWDAIIVDECHLLKNPTSVQSKRIHKLTKDCPLVIGLSGTPRCNSDEDLYGIMHALNCGQWGKIKKTEFERDWGIRELKQFGGHTFYKFMGIKPYLKEIWEAGISKYFLGADYEEQEMPELCVLEEKIPFEKTENYTKALKGIVNLPEYASTFQKSIALMKAQQVANGFVYGEDDTGKSTVIKLPGFVNKKLEKLKSYLVPGKKIIIVYRFQEDKEILLKAIPSATDILDDFRKTKDVLLMQAQQGVGVNLQIADEIWFYTMDSSYINYVQMIHRAWRKGRTDKVIIRIFTYDGSLEEGIWNAVQKKIGIADAFFDILKKIRAELS